MALDINNDIQMTESRSLVLPKSNSAITGPVTGQMRYNTTSEEVEIYQGSTGVWRSVRFKEPGLITQQSLGAGDGATIYFGPLNPAPTATAQSGVTWDTTQMAKNLLVVVENVIQLADINYLVTQNPTIAGNTYSGSSSKSIASGTNVLYFSTFFTASIGASSAANQSVTMTVGAVSTGSQAQLAVGQQVANSETNFIYGTITAGSGGAGSYTINTSQAFAAVPSTTRMVATSVNGVLIYPSVVLTGSTITTATSLTVLTAAVSGNVATLTFTNLGSTPFVAGQSITVTGINLFNGTFTVLASPAPSATSVSYTLALTNQAGVVTASSKVSNAYATYIPNGTTITSYTTDGIDGALTSATLSANVTSQTIPIGMTYTIVDGSNVGSGYYLQFTEPVPLGKNVTVLHGFDR